MKKISAVLLVLVLVGSVAFAGFTGSAEANFGMNLDNQEYGFQNVEDWELDLVFHEALGESAGEGDVYAEISASFTFSFERNADDGLLAIDADDLDVSFDYAKISGDNWYVSILGAMAAPNFASSAIDVYEDLAGDDQTVDLDPSVFVVEGAGVEVGYADYKFGIAAPRDPSNDLDGNAYDIFGSVATPDFALADGLTLAFGAAGRLSNGAGGNAASGSVKGTYTMDDITASVAADVVYDTDFMAEVAVNTVIDIVTLDVYFATHDKSEDENALGNMVATPAYVDGDTNILSAKAAFSIDQFDITVTGKDILNASIIGASVDFAATEEMTVNVNGGYTLLGVNASDFYAGAGVTYTVEDYTAKLSGKYSSGNYIEMAASIESTTIVPGATLALAWEDANDLLKTDADGLEEMGIVKASINIAF